MRRGATLIELLVTLVVFGIVFGLVTQSALYHARLQRRFQSADASARGVRQAVAILANVVRSALPGDVVAGQASDSALDLMARVGAGAGCAHGNAFIVASPDSDGVPAADYAAYPRAGDRLLVFDDRSRPPAWRARTVTAVQAAVDTCAVVPPRGAVVLLLDSTLDAGPAGFFRVERRTRYTLYRSGDGRWYLGLREWNAGAGRFNNVAPVAGPLHARSVYAGRTGLRFEYLTPAGRVLAPPVAAPDSVAAISITARPADSSVAALTLLVALRGRR